jgi:nucleoid DNA-binding protein
VRIVNLGKFGLTHRQPRMGRNPRTGEEVQIAARTSIKFKATATLADKVA